MELDTTLPSLDNYRVGTKNSFLIRTNLIPTIECQLWRGEGVRGQDIGLRRLKSKNGCNERSFIFCKQSKFKLKIPQRQDNAGAVCNSGMGMLFLCIYVFYIISLRGVMNFFFSCMIHHAWYMMHDARCMMQDARCTMHSARYIIHDGCLVVFA